MFEILSPGMLTTVQDGGRYGYQRMGVPVCGAMDWMALEKSNLLTGNEGNEAVLEMMAIGPVLRFKQSNLFALSGGTFSATLNDVPIQNNQAYLAQPGDVLDCGMAKQGFRACLAFSGGMDIPLALGSRSTCLAAGFGGYHGRALKKGDQIAFRAPQFWLSGLPARKLEEPEAAEAAALPLRVVLGPQDDAFSEEGLAAFFSSPYQLSSQCDRMGYRLTGEHIALKEGHGPNILSDGVAFGSIQVPNGQPIIMMADRQATGGYVKLGTVITADLPRLAQKRPGDAICFAPVSVEEAQNLLHQIKRRLLQLSDELNRPELW